MTHMFTSVHLGQCLGMLMDHDTSWGVQGVCCTGMLWCALRWGVCQCAMCDGVYTGVCMCTPRPVSGYVDGSRERVVHWCAVCVWRGVHGCIVVYTQAGVWVHWRVTKTRCWTSVLTSLVSTCCRHRPTAPAASITLPRTNSSASWRVTAEKYPRWVSVRHWYVTCHDRAASWRVTAEKYSRWHLTVMCCMRQLYCKHTAKAADIWSAK